MAPWPVLPELAGKTLGTMFSHRRKPEIERGRRRAHHGENRRQRRLGSMGRGSMDLGDSCGSCYVVSSEGKGREVAKWREGWRLWLGCSTNEAKAWGNVWERGGSGVRGWGLCTAKGREAVAGGRGRPDGWAPPVSH